MSLESYHKDLRIGDDENGGAQENVLENRVVFYEKIDFKDPWDFLRNTKYAKTCI